MKIKVISNINTLAMMKTFVSNLAVIAILLMSCSTDNDLYHDTDAVNISETALETYVISPENGANPYDIAGQMYIEVLDLYLQTNQSSEDISKVNEEIQYIMTEYVPQFSSQIEISSITTEKIMDVINSSKSSLETNIDGFDLTDHAKSSLTDFINSMLALEEEEYQVIYDHIIGYESKVLDNTVLTQEDQRAILTSTSLLRHLTFTIASERPDKDWEISVGNMMPMVKGALEDTWTAVSVAVFSTVIQYKSITVS